jgi:hypothetical protein
MGGFPYGLILLLAAGVLAFRHARTDLASSRSKWVVGGIALMSVLAFPSWPLTVASVQLGVCVYVTFHQMVADELTQFGGDGGSKSATVGVRQPDA